MNWQCSPTQRQHVQILTLTVCFLLMLWSDSLMHHCDRMCLVQAKPSQLPDNCTASPEMGSRIRPWC
jgi:hypothetical protein